MRGKGRGAGHQRVLPLRTLLAQAWMLAGCTCAVGWIALRAVAGLLALGHTSAYTLRYSQGSLCRGMPWTRR